MNKSKIILQLLTPLRVVTRKSETRSVSKDVKKLEPQAVYIQMAALTNNEAVSQKTRHGEGHGGQLMERLLIVQEALASIPSSL